MSEKNRVKEKDRHELPYINTHFFKSVKLLMFYKFIILHQFCIEKISSVLNLYHFYKHKRAHCQIWYFDQSTQILNKKEGNPSGGEWQLTRIGEGQGNQIHPLKQRKFLFIY